jgi:hypothetical protein
MITKETKQMTIEAFRRQANAGRLIHPPYQRMTNAWSIGQERELLDSIEKGYPISNVTVIVRPVGKKTENWIVGDGAHRISILLDESGKGNRILDTYPINVEFVYGATLEQEEEIFDRLNSGSSIKPIEDLHRKYYKTNIWQLGERLGALDAIHKLSGLGDDNIRFSHESAALIVIACHQFYDNFKGKAGSKTKLIASVLEEFKDMTTEEADAMYLFYSKLLIDVHFAMGSQMACGYNATKKTFYSTPSNFFFMTMLVAFARSKYQDRIVANKNELIAVTKKAKEKSALESSGIIFVPTDGTYQQGNIWKGVECFEHVFNTVLEADRALPSDRIVELLTRQVYTK